LTPQAGDLYNLPPKGPPMPEMLYAAALRDALCEALDTDPAVFLLGEDIGAYGGAFKVTAGLLDRYGPERIRDTPIAENTIVGLATGAALRA